MRNNPLKSIARKGIRAVRLVSGWLRFIRQYAAFSKIADNRFPLRWSDRWPCLNDHTANTGFDRHYVYHTAWAARLIAANAPERHVDISSCLRFVTLVSAFVPMDFYDYRPADLSLDGLNARSADITNLPFENESIGSLSCMHVVEHIGLGRYGDQLDAKGDLKAIGELNRVLAPGGDLYFVVPVGASRIQYNAHRIYAFNQITELFDELELKEFALIPDSGGLISNASSAQADAQQYGCGCFWFRKQENTR